MIKSVTRVRANLFKKVVRLKRRMWGMRGPEHAWSQFAKSPGQQSQVNVLETHPPHMPFQSSKVSSLRHDGYSQLVAHMGLVNVRVTCFLYSIP